MPTLALLLCPASVPSSVALVLDVFQLANRVAADAARARGGVPAAPPWRVWRLSADGRPVTTPLGALAVDGSLARAAEADVLLVPAVGERIEPVLADNAALVAQLRALRAAPLRPAAGPQLPRFASLCSGAFVLAEAGLLDQARATTHWRLEAAFRRRYPAVRLAIDALLTHDGEVCCSGGAYAGLALCLHLVRLQGGDWLARQVADLLVIDAERGGESQLRFAPRVPPTAQADAGVQRLQRWIASHHAQPLALQTMAERLHCSPRTLLRRFRAATGLTPLDYLQRVRVSAAEQQLGRGRHTVESVAWAVGYADRAAFAKVFKRLTGESPAAFGRRVQAGAAPLPAAVRSASGLSQKPKLKPSPTPKPQPKQADAPPATAPRSRRRAPAATAK